MRLFACLALCLAPAIAQAQDTPGPCNADPAEWLARNGAAMDGFWVDTTVVSVLNGTTPLPLPAPETVAITPIEGGLRGTGGEMGVTYDLMLVEGDLTIEPPDGVPALDGEEMGLLLGCDVNAMPRLRGSVSMVIDGVAVTGTVWAVVVSTEEMHFWFRFDSPYGTIRQQSIVTQ